MFVKSVMPRFVKNSRGDKSIEIEIKTYEGVFKCSAPSGKSTGKTEVACWNKNGVDYSMKLVEGFSKVLIHKNFIIRRISEIKKLNDMMIAFEKRHGKMGGNVWYALEGAFLRAAAADIGKELWEFINDDVNEGLNPKTPMPIGNCIGGGLHSKKLYDRRPDFQEFLLIGNGDTFGKAVTNNLKAYHYAKKLLTKAAPKKFKEPFKLRNDEGAWMTARTNEEVLEIISRVAKKFDLRIGIDAATGSFFEDGYYNYKNKSLVRDKVDQIDYMLRLIKRFDIFYTEDGMNEDDFGGFKSLNVGANKMRGDRLIVGDDLTTTHLKRLQRAVRGGSINAIIIKPNQVGSIIEVKKVVEFCKKKDIVMIFSHRSGETMDDILGDYCVGFGGDFLKAGIYGKERMVKLKRVMEIEKKIHKR
jgi:enolase